MKTKFPAKIRTIEQAYEFVLKAKTCLIFGSKTSDLPSLWEVVDLPERKPGASGWGAKVEAVWSWKNELPAQFPDEIFYGKLPGGLAMLMCIEHLRQVHYPAQHRPVSEGSALARRAFELIRSEPHTTAELRKALSPSCAISKSKVDGALVELQVTLNITRSNARGLKRDTWLPFAEQYPSIGGEA
jgi:hypothetical protein